MATLGSLSQVTPTTKWRPCSGDGAAGALWHDLYGEFMAGHFVDHVVGWRGSSPGGLAVQGHHENLDGLAFLVHDLLDGLVVVGGCEQMVGGWGCLWHVAFVLVVDDVLDEGVEVVRPVEGVTEEELCAGDDQEEADQAAEGTQVPNHTPAFHRSGFVSWNQRSRVLDTGIKGSRVLDTG